MLTGRFSSDDASIVAALIELGVQVIDPCSSGIFRLNKTLKPGLNFLTDFSYYYFRKDTFLLFNPSSCSELLSILQLLRASGLRYVIRGNGHSLNASSIPGPEDILISLTEIRDLDISNLSKGFIDAGAGSTMNEINSSLSKLGYTLPVSPDGSDLGSPTLGGFLQAGGICSSSYKYGGFWNHIISITAITDLLDLVNFCSSDPIFPRLFGTRHNSYIITNARLKVISRDESTSVDTRPINKPIPHYSSSRSPIWFNFHCDNDQSNMVVKTITSVCSELRPFWQLYDIYSYPVNNNLFIPPNIFTSNVSSFVRVGAWGCPINRSTHVLEYISKKFASISNICTGAIAANAINFRHYPIRSFAASSRMNSIIRLIRSVLLYS